MACVAIHTGTSFLSTVLAHVDCQAQTIGAYGYGALANPGSSVSLALGGLLTTFIALIGIRLLLGARLDGNDAVVEILKVGIVLTLATSWPAWRTIGYDVVMNGPGEVASSIGGASGLPGQRRDMQSRLQNLDDGLVSMTMFGTGRLTGGVAAGTDLGDSFRGVALADQTGFGWGRVLFLAETIGPWALVRLSGGILLAIAPLMAGLLFFAGTMGLFIGWLRALAFTALGAMTLTVLQGVQLAVLESWVGDVLAQRDGGILTPSAPTELVVLTMAFAVLITGALFLIARLAFFPNTPIFPRLWSMRQETSRTANPDPVRTTTVDNAPGSSSRAVVIVDAVENTMRREDMQRMSLRMDGSGLAASGANQPGQRTDPGTPGQVESLGSSYRRTHRRSSAASERRDRPA